jgi:hypothetical protein
MKPALEVLGCRVTKVSFRSFLSSSIGEEVSQSTLDNHQGILLYY